MDCRTRGDQVYMEEKVDKFKTEYLENDGLSGKAVDQFNRA